MQKTVKGSELRQHIGWELDFGATCLEPDSEWLVLETVDAEGNVRLAGDIEFGTSAECFYPVRTPPETPDEPVKRITFEGVPGAALGQHIGKEMCLELFVGNAFYGPLNWAVLKSVNPDGEVELETGLRFGTSADETYFIREPQKVAAAGSAAAT